MSVTARAVPLRAPETPAATGLPSARGLLRLVPQRRSTAAKTPFAVVLVVLLVGGLLGLLLLNTLVAQGSFRLSRLGAESRTSSPGGRMNRSSATAVASGPTSWRTEPTRIRPRAPAVIPRYGRR